MFGGAEKTDAHIAGASVIFAGESAVLPIFALGKASFYRRESFFKVGDNVVDVFRADGQPDGVRINAGVREFLRRKLGVRRRGGMNHQRFHIRDVRQQ